MNKEFLYLCSNLTENRNLLKLNVYQTLNLKLYAQDKIR
jgi:hypothetical protein